MNRCFFKNRPYTPTKPTPDDTESCDTFDRLMLRHNREDQPELFIAPRGELTAGWVVGVFTDNVPGLTLFVSGPAADINL